MSVSEIEQQGGYNDTYSVVAVVKREHLQAG